MAAATGTKPPATLRVNPDGIPSELQAIDQWLLWKWERRQKADGTPTWTKPPHQPSGAYAASTRRETWTGFTTVRDAYARGTFGGVGFALTEDDGYVGVDLDDCRDPGTGFLKPDAQGVVERLGSYTEVSPSGAGLHIIVRGDIPEDGRKNDGVECYKTDRYLTLTGQRLRDAPSTIRQMGPELAEWFKETFPEPPEPAAVTVSPQPVSLDDADILERMFHSVHGDAIKRLWEGDTSAYKGDHSRADLALCRHLAWWTGADPARVDRMFRACRLMRPKWDEPRGAQTYGERTINLALSRLADVYRPDAPSGTSGRKNGTGTDDRSGRDGERERHNRPGRNGHDTSTYSGGAGRAAETNNEEQRSYRRCSQATILVSLAQQSGAELFHDPSEETYATVPIGNHRETHRLRSKALRRWLARLLYEAEGRIPGAQAVQDALTTLEGIALFDGLEIPVRVRVAEHDGAIYLDLGDGQWRAVEITPQGWRIVDDPPVRFRRPSGMLQLPEPERGGSLEELRDLLNIPGDTWPLVGAWMVGALRPAAPYPVLVLTGEQGSAKTTTGRVLRSLVDPATAPLRSEPRENRDLMIAASNGWVVALDNLSRIPVWLSDALCRLATGGGYATRALYSDDDETILDAQRPIIITAIDDVVSRPDLLDRAIIITLEPIADERRRTERELWTAVEVTRPRILGALLDAVAHGLAHQDEVQLDRLPRMADFARWVVAAEPALGVASGAFLQAYTSNRRDAHALTLEASPVGAYLVKVAPFAGTASDLLEEVNDLATEAERRSKGWPSSARTLSGLLRRLAPTLRASGVPVKFEREAKTGRRLIHLEKSRDFASDRHPPSPPTCEGDAEGDANGGRGDAGRVAPQLWGDAGDAGDAKFQSYDVPGNRPRERERFDV